MSSDESKCSRCSHVLDTETREWLYGPPPREEGEWVCASCYVRAWPSKVHLVFHFGLPEWVERTFRTVEWLDRLKNGFPNTYGVVQFFPRRVAETVAWQQQWEQHRGRGLPIEPYSYRGWCRWSTGEILILVDEIETPDSLQWIVLHELGHLSVGNAHFVNHAMDRENRNEGREHYEWKDDAGHEADSEERLVNRVATAYMGGREYARPWWRERVNAKLAGVPQAEWPDHPRYIVCRPTDVVRAREGSDA